MNRHAARSFDRLGAAAGLGAVALLVALLMFFPALPAADEPVREIAQAAADDEQLLLAGDYVGAVMGGLWLLFGQEGNPSPLARVIGLPDVVVHKWLGYGLLVIGLVGLVVWRLDLGRFAAETFRWDRGDRAWVVAWPKAALTGRFSRHEGHFDPGQRVANVVLVGTLLLLVVSGIGLTLLHGGALFVWLHHVHLWATYAFGTMLVGHVAVASGILPGYRGAWRAMHLGGRLPEHVAAKLWPAWLESQRRSDEDSRRPRGS